MFYFTEQSSHLYTLASSNKKMKTSLYSDRASAKYDMYKFIDKHNLKVVEKYDDHHFKTYICDDGTRFYINRV